MSVRRLALCLALVLFAVPSVAGDAPSRVANDFYAIYSSFHSSVGIPNAVDRAKYAPYISPAFEKLLADAAAAERDFAKRNKGSPPLIEGDLFTSMFEGATKYKVGACKEQDAHASCNIDLTYDGGKDAPVHWTDTLYLTKTGSGWRVDDIAYGASWAFANQGRLTEVLRQTIADSGG